MRGRRPSVLRRMVTVAALALAALATALTGAPAAQASEPDGPIGRGEVMDRSWSWVAERVAYSWDGCYRNQFGCYRPDCSGYVSMAWNLGSSLNTWALWNVTVDIPAEDLNPGDALLKDSDGTDHVALFVRWADAAHTQPLVREEYDFGHVAEERVWRDGLRGFTPRRYNRLDDLMPYGSIRAKYDAMGGLGSVLGPPVRGERDSRLGGRFQQFRNGIIIWHPDVAYAIYGDILAKYWATDSEQRWGFPTMDEAEASRAPDGTRGRYQFFERGLFLWSAPTGTHPVHGEIYKAFHNAGHEAALGYPLTDETDEAGGKAQKFQKATIHWNPSRGTWITDN
ncbi:LGFP repeat-containing protein [Streptomyces sp. URMC 126]|uniref:LGFP repeat-containing protein n=1 Tax=Streptomyces sp. URMC 126 TaxID=3423401 RepID=UPI003F198F5C